MKSKMNKTGKIFFNKKAIELTSITLLFLLSLLGAFSSFNRTTENAFSKITGQRTLDTSIAIIHIDDNDIEKLGGWPLKRSYYALLISKLSSLGAAKIGVEVLLSHNAATQSIYNDLLDEEIKRSGRVVVSSLILNDGAADSIIYSQPKLDNLNLKSGHLNYISDDGIYIPNSIKVNGTTEKSFSSALADKELTGKRTKVNFYNSWKNYQ